MKYIWPVMVAFIFSSCTEFPPGKVSEEEIYSPVITINSPDDGEALDRSDAVDIIVTFENNDRIKQYEIAIEDALSGEIVYQNSGDAKAYFLFYFRSEPEGLKLPPSEYLLRASSWDKDDSAAAVKELICFSIN